MFLRSIEPFEIGRLTPAGGAAASATISGSNFTASLAPAAGAAFRYENTLFACPIYLIAGADTVLKTASIDGIPASIDVQTNTGGFIVAIVSVFIPSTRQSSTAYLTVQCVGTAPTSVRVGGLYIGVGLTRLAPFVASSTTTAATSRNVSLPYYANGFLLCAAINDVATANQCTWTGTTNPTELDDAALGTARGSSAFRATGTESQAFSITATFDVISIGGISLAVASWR